MKKELFALIPIFALTSTAQAWMCPTNFSQINPGDTMQHVEQICGKPTSQKASTAQDDSAPQQWSYYVQVSPPNPATIQMTVVFANNKLANITMNSQNLTSTSACGPVINIGDSMQTVEAACGKPQFVTKGEAPANAAPPTKIVQFVYPGPPPNTLIFENGVLKSRQ